jgi:hypothetical protein
VVNYQWFDTWLTQLSKTATTSFIKGSSLVKYIKNKPLIKRSGQLLRKGLKEFDDFVVLPESGWNFLKQRYGADFEIKLDYK